ncbi:hypothetical protein SI65_05731 [Aspergillus cristatus]|uniref:Uncharacterized protein n=1 Tax=Aspergillus cristatus TaxID=573508 RepID=A0A1E3BDT2_ASPCR|nr:hypothetical protein SI65_05731 [Aspergillus cristatus]
MTRTIYLALFNNGPKPNTNTLGKLIQVDGNPATGFHLQFVRNYNIASDTLSEYKLTPLAEVDDKYVADPAGTERSIETTARDRLESVAMAVKPPGRNAKPFDPEAPNCQNWLYSYVQKLIEEGFVEASAGLVVQDAPKVFEKA